jgi:hypothetical protein
LVPCKRFRGCRVLEVGFNRWVGKEILGYN